jgi:hypothetical protein
VGTSLVDASMLNVGSHSLDALTLGAFLLIRYFSAFLPPVPAEARAPFVPHADN